MPVQNMPPWLEDYFELKASEKQQTQEELPSTYIKAGHPFPSVKVAEVPLVKLSTGLIPGGE